MTFTALVVDVRGREVESFSDALLEAGALSVTFEEVHPASRNTLPVEVSEPGSWPLVRLTALCGKTPEPQEVLTRACASSGIVVQAHQLSSVPDEDWVAKSRSAFGPVQVSPRLWILPSWCAPPEADALNLVLDPGLAFGTGSHASTRLCLRWLERRITGGEAVLDYGCGSGILAIASLMLGARRAVGIDIDSDALAAARGNARRNRVAAEFLDSGSPLDFTADLVVANILANPLKILAPILLERCRRGGQIALSGILVEQANEVEECYAPWIAFAPSDEEEGWVCLSGVKQ